MPAILMNSRGHNTVTFHQFLVESETKAGTPGYLNPPVMTRLHRRDQQFGNQWGIREGHGILEIRQVGKDRPSENRSSADIGERMPASWTGRLLGSDGAALAV
jgi:hypothetical protein